jgi:hypothetical protein
VARPANPIANIFQNAGNVKILSRGEKTGEGGRQKPFLPGSKTFAFLVPLRRCVKNDSGPPPRSSHHFNLEIRMGLATTAHKMFPSCGTV